MGLFRDAINRLLDKLDPPKRPFVRVPCPACRADLSERNMKSEVRNELIYYRCTCGHASAWHWNGHGPQLIYGEEPGEDTEVYEALD